MPVCDGAAHTDKNTRSFFQKHPLGFSAKIVLTVFCIMALSQATSSLFSVLSFEEHYLSAMTSKYEILGKDLKRRIEQALKFGKSLEHFIGIEKLAEPIIRQADDIDEIFLGDEAGHLWYTSKGMSSSSAGQAPLTLDTATVDPTPKHKPQMQESSRLRFKEGRYFLLFPVTAAFGKQKGVLGLAFSRDALQRKKDLLVKQALFNLGLSVCITAALLFLMIEFGFSRPLSNWISRRIKSAETHFTYEVDMDSAPLELKELNAYMNTYVRKTQDASNKLGKLLEQMQPDREATGLTGPTVLRMKQILEGKSHDTD